MTTRQRSGVGAWRRAAMAAAVCLAAATAQAQTTAERGYVAARGGLHVERSEDNLRGTVGGGGIAIGFGQQRTWSPEIEFWHPAWLRTDAADGRHRDILGAFAVRRRFGTAGVRPFVVIGGTVARTQTEFTICTAPARFPPGTSDIASVSCSDPDVVGIVREKNSSTSLYALGGAGAEIRLSRRLRLVPDVRVDFGITSLLVRPSLGVAVAF